jgi:hypothetical protein
MEAVSQRDELVPFTATEEGATSPFAVEADFEVILDAPFMTVNRIGTDFIGEVVLTGQEDPDRRRVRKVTDLARRHGQTLYARKHGEYGTILMFFTAADLSGGL